MTLEDQRGLLGRVLLHPSWVRTWDVAIDGGAYRGDWALDMAKVFKRVIAFEADPENYEKSAAAVRAAENITIFRNALFSRPCLVAISNETKGGKDCGRFVKLDGDGDIQAMTIDSLELPSCGLIKLDIEGAEFDALVGAHKTIKHHKPVLIVEMKRHGRRFGWPDGVVEELLTRWGYNRVITSHPDAVFVHGGAA